MAGFERTVKHIQPAKSQVPFIRRWAGGRGGWLTLPVGTANQAVCPAGHADK